MLVIVIIEPIRRHIPSRGFELGRRWRVPEVGHAAVSARVLAHAAVIVKVGLQDRVLSEHDCVLTV